MSRNMSLVSLLLRPSIRYDADMTEMKFISNRNRWEQRFGYSRLARVNDLVLVTGTTAVDEDGEPHPSRDSGKQATRCLEIIESALQEIGLDRNSILRLRVFLTEIRDAESVGDAFHQFFGDHKPGLTMLEVSKLISPEFVVEIECDAHA
jgi:enamine deaminase RidA (YjgF/YER057c/UK114 family)